LTTLATKQNILDAAGYAYNFDRQVYFNRSAKKIFSVEFLEDRDAAEIEQSIREDTDSREWRFYFTSPPSDSVKRQIASVLG
jgi:hypothetical protein